MYTLHGDNLKSNKGHRDILQYCVFFMVFAMLSLLCSAGCYSAYAARKWLKSLKCITNFDDDWFWDKLAQILCSNLWSEGLKSAFSDDDNGWRRKRFPWIQDQPRYQWPEYAQHFIKQCNTVVSFSNLGVPIIIASNLQLLHTVPPSDNQLDFHGPCPFKKVYND